MTEMYRCSYWTNRQEQGLLCTGPNGKRSHFWWRRRRAHLRTGWYAWPRMEGPAHSEGNDWIHSSSSDASKILQRFVVKTLEFIPNPHLKTSYVKYFNTHSGSSHIMEVSSIQCFFTHDSRVTVTLDKVLLWHAPVFLPWRVILIPSNKVLN